MTAEPAWPHHTQLNWLFQQLNNAYGPLNWWPAKTRTEMLIGAVLVQNTAWANVEKAMANLRAKDWLTTEAICNLKDVQLAAAIRPAGYFNIKTQRLKALCGWLLEQGGLSALDGWSSVDLRKGLLSVKGVGPETADCILLYAFKRPVFVVDAYTQRLLLRLGWLNRAAEYEKLRRVFERTQPQDADHLGQYHAVIVEHAKRHCRSKPICKNCCLAAACEYPSQLQ